MSNKRVKLYVEEGKLCIERLVPIVEVNPHTKCIQYTDSDTDVVTETDIEVTPDQLDRGYGFGSFLLSLSIDQIEFDQKIIDFLKPCINRQYSSLGDLFGFTLEGPNIDSINKAFGEGNYLNYASLLSICLGIPAEDCSVHHQVFKEMEAYLAEQKAA